MRSQRPADVRTASRFRHPRRMLAATTLIGATLIMLLALGCSNPSGSNSPGGTVPVPDWYVPGDFSSIQAAINNAAAGESILVSSSTYAERITLKDGVTLLGEDRDRTG